MRKLLLWGPEARGQNYLQIELYWKDLEGISAMALKAKEAEIFKLKVLNKYKEIKLKLLNKKFNYLTSISKLKPLLNEIANS